MRSIGSPASRRSARTWAGVKPRPYAGWSRDPLLSWCATGLSRRGGRGADGAPAGWWPLRIHRGGEV